MRTLEIKDNIDDEGTTHRTITFDGQQAMASWSSSVERDLQTFHGLDVSDEISHALVYELDDQFSLTDEEKANVFKVLKENMKV